MENEALKQELASLKDKYQTDVETLERQLKEAKQLLNTAQQRYESSDELMSSSLKGGDMLQTIRTAMVESAQSMAHENEELKLLDDMFKQTHQALARLDDRAVKISSQATQSIESVQILDNTPRLLFPTLYLLSKRFLTKRTYWLSTQRLRLHALVKQAADLQWWRTR
ncbi:hypothetical protein [Vibrio parahaemolyticus]|uniref:hypothetical protein n=1 Tax=Vibrio parahaemolyticus TaxID=670 RepID=UPI000B125BBA